MGWSLVDLGVLVDQVDLGVCVPEVFRYGGEGGTQSGGPAGLWGGKLYVTTGLVSELSDVNWFSSLVIRSLDRLSLDFFSLLFLRTVLPSLVLFSPLSTTPLSRSRVLLLKEQQRRRTRMVTRTQRPAITRNRASTMMKDRGCPRAMRGIAARVQPP